MGLIEDNSVDIVNGQFVNTKGIDEKVCMLWPFCNDFCFYASIKDGLIKGLGGSLYGDVLITDISLPNFIDGSVYFNFLYKFFEGAKYIIDFDYKLFYDTKNEILAIGNIDDNVITLRIMNNVYVIMGELNISAIIITDIKI
jgi:hypothetical protein